MNAAANTLTFADSLDETPWESLADPLAAATPEDVAAALHADAPRQDQLAALLSPAADLFLEQMAGRARDITLRRFGRAVVLYAPLYVSNYCLNACLYCGFNVGNKIVRRTLSPADIEKEMGRLGEAGFQHLLLVSGDHPGQAPLEYLADAVARAHDRFASVSVEVYPMDRAGYERLVSAGCDGLTIYQETYDRARYLDVHPRGWKRDFTGRLRAIEAGGEAGMRSLGLGSLLGLSDWRREAAMLGLHARHLMKRFWRCRIGFSFPRICAAAGGFTPPCPVADRDMVHMMCALRIAFPDAELVVSTRESAAMRDNLIRLGVATRFSAGSRTEPGGYSKAGSATGQFEVSDDRSPATVAAAIAAAGYDPVWKDWDRAFAGRA